MAAAAVMRPEEERLFQGQPKGFPLGDFAVEDVMLPEDDDMGIESDEESDEEADVVTESGFGSVIVVDGLPQTTPEKQDKLVGILRKLYDSIGTIREGGLILPQDTETNMTRGFAFVEFSNPREARAAQQQTDGWALTKTITFKVTMFDDFEKFGKVPDEYEKPERQPYQPQDNLQGYMLDKRARDQFVIRHGDTTEVLWNDPQRLSAESVYSREFWTGSYVQWSPHGSYLATMHQQGVAVWGTGAFSRIHRYAHPMCRLMAFSPNERYLVTHSLVEPETPQDKATMVLNLFDTRLGRCLRNFTGPADEFAVGAAAGAWPIFKWAGHADDKYFARLSKGMISVYEAPEMTLLDKKSIRLDAVFDFAWSPTEPILCAFQLEQAGGNLPARISLIRIPDRKELRQKNLFSVSEVKLFWQPEGKFLAVQVDRFTKTRKTTYTSFELFSVHKRDIPMEVLDLPSKVDKITDFAWEPKGTRFAVLHGEGNRPTLSLYDMEGGGKGVQLVNSQPNKTVNCIAWSPQGRFLVLGGLKAMQGQLEFFNADDFEVMSAAEHFMCTDIEWDPTGRFVATAVNQMHQMENGFNLWTFNGHLVYRVPRERFFQFSWRPRALSLLTEEQERDIQRNLKTNYSRRYEEEDLAALHETDTQIMADRQRLADEWRAWLESKQAYIDELAAGRQKIMGDALEEQPYNIIEAEVEEILGVEEVIIR